MDSSEISMMAGLGLIAVAPLIATAGATGLGALTILVGMALVARGIATT